MVTEIEELFSIKRMMNDVKEELIADGHYPGKDVKVGIMLEIPGTVALIKHLKDEVDFFSVGTNDLIQYLLAVDRNKDQVAYLYNPFHPAVVEVLMRIKEEVDKIGKEVTICGEMASKIFPALMLLGMGYRNFSMNSMSLAEIKRVFTQIHYSHIRHIVKQLPRLSSRHEIEEYLIEALLRKYPDIFIQKSIF